MILFTAVSPVARAEPSIEKELEEWERAMKN